VTLATKKKEERRKYRKEKRGKSFTGDSQKKKGRGKKTSLTGFGSGWSPKRLGLLERGKGGD